MLVKPYPTRLVCLMIRLKPSVRALVTSSVSATSTAGHQVSIVVARRPPDLVRLVFGQQQAQAFLDGMRGGDLVGRILGGEGGVEPGLLLDGEVLVAGEQQLPAGPDFVGGGAAAAVQLPGDPLTDLGDHEVGEGDEMPLVDCDPRVRQGGADPGSTGTTAPARTPASATPHPPSTRQRTALSPPSHRDRQ